MNTNDQAAMNGQQETQPAGITEVTQEATLVAPVSLLNEEEEKAAFSGWATEKGFCLDCAFFEDGNNFEDPDTRLAYDIWMARAALSTQRLADLERVCAGLSQEMIDGGWTAQGIRRHCRQVEMDRKELFEVTRDALRLLKDLVGQLQWAIGTPALDAIDPFLDRHVETLFRIAANLSPVARQESV